MLDTIIYLRINLLYYNNNLIYQLSFVLKIVHYFYGINVVPVKREGAKTNKGEGVKSTDPPRELVRKELGGYTGI